MGPEEFLLFAEKTVQGARPVDHRVAIGRAYYGLFNFAAELLRSCQCNIPENPGAYGAVRDYLLAVTCQQTVMDAGSWIGDAKGARNKADYNLTDKKIEGRNLANLLVQEARIHFNNLTTTFAQNRLEIIADLRAYQEKIANR